MYVTYYGEIAVNGYQKHPYNIMFWMFWWDGILLIYGLMASLSASNLLGAVIAVFFYNFPWVQALAAVVGFGLLAGSFSGYGISSDTDKYWAQVFWGNLVTYVLYTAAGLTDQFIPKSPR